MSAPADLRERIARDLEPVRPLRPPLVRALSLVPLAAVILIAVPALHFFRPDLAAIGFLRAWGFSIGQATAGIVIVAAALREAVPGRSLPRTVIAGILSCGVIIPAALLALTAPRFDIGPAAGRALADGVGCFRASAFAAVPALMVASFLAARAFPARPSVAGALYGLGGGLIADAGLRLYCEYSQPEHVILAHGGAIAASILAGVALAWATRRVR
jgi:hypothetical protein